MAAHIAPCEVIKRLIEEERVQSFKIVDFNETVDISYEQFLENYLIPNRPCLFCPKSTEIWTSRNEWVCEFDGSPNFGFFEMLGISFCLPYTVQSSYIAPYVVNARPSIYLSLLSQSFSDHHFRCGPCGVRRMFPSVFR